MEDRLYLVIRLLVGVVGQHEVSYCDADCYR